jgi:tetratricopeptide (TPR) repeat protein
MKRALIAVGLLVGLTLLAVPAGAQTGTARGKVVDSEGHGVAEADVLVEFLGEISRKFELKTDKRGEFIQVGLHSGFYRFTVSKEGYQTRFVEERVNLGDPTVIPEITLRSQDEVAREQGRPTESARQKFAEAAEFANAGQYDEAEALLAELTEETPEVPEIYQNLAFIAVKRQDWESAEAHYLKTLELRPGDSNATSGLIQVYMETGQQEKAQELVSQAAGENPEDASAQFNRAIFLVNSGKTEEAIPVFEAALAADPSMAEAHYHLGTLLVGQGKVPEALQHLETYLSMDPKNEQNIATANGLIAALKQ